MKKALLFLLIICIIIFGAGVFILSSGRLTFDTHTTHITVKEGSVNVYRLRSGGQRKPSQILKAGENLTVESFTPSDKSSFVYGLLKKSFPDFVDRSKLRIADLTSRVFGTHKTVEISSPKLQSILEQASAGQLREVDLDLSSEGYGLFAVVSKGPLNLSVFASGYLYLSANLNAAKQLKTQIHSITINDIQLPSAILRAVESLFAESLQNDHTLPFTFKQLEHREGLIKAELQMQS